MRTYRRVAFKAKVKDCNLGYVGSLSLPEQVMNNWDILVTEKVTVYNLTNGEIFETYAMAGDCVCLNGAAARKGEVGDLIEIVTWRIE